MTIVKQPLQKICISANEQVMLTRIRDQNKECRSEIEKHIYRMRVMRIRDNVNKALSQFIFEPNDPITWDAVASALKQVVAPHCFDYVVKCDRETNNPEKVKSNRMSCFVGFKLDPWSEFLYLNTEISQGIV